MCPVRVLPPLAFPSAVLPAHRAAHKRATQTPAHSPRSCAAHATRASNAIVRGSAPSAPRVVLVSRSMPPASRAPRRRLHPNHGVPESASRLPPTRLRTVPVSRLSRTGHPRRPTAAIERRAQRIRYPASVIVREMAARRFAMRDDRPFPDRCSWPCAALRTSARPVAPPATLRPNVPFGVLPPGRHTR